MPNEIPASVMPLGTLESMLLDELRRAREANDKTLSAITDLNTQLLLLRQDREHDKSRLAAIETDLANLKQWRDRADGGKGLAGALAGSPVIGWIVAAAAVVYSKLGFSTN